MLTILNNNTLAKRYCWYRYQYCFWNVLPIPRPILLWQYFTFITFSNVHFSPPSSVNKVNRM